MFTVEAALNWGQNQLKVLGKVEAKLSVERLLEDLLQCDRVQLHLQASKNIPAKLVKKYVTSVKLRRKRIPLDYLLGCTHFWDEVLEVGPGCLIPRPSTEILIEKFIENSGFAQS